MNNSSSTIARLFLHEKVGIHFNARPDDDSLLGTFRYAKDNGEVKPPVRIGTLGQCFIVADQKHGYVFERFFKEDIPGLLAPDCPVTLVFPDPDIAPATALMSWLLDIESRAYPLVAAMPERSYLTANLRLTYRPEQTFIATPGEALVFDAVKTRKTRDSLLALGQEALVKWRYIAEIREESCFLSDLVTDSEKNLALKKLVQANQIVNSDVWLPAPNTAESLALDWATRGSRMGKTKGLPSPINAPNHEKENAL